MKHLGQFFSIQILIYTQSQKKRTINSLASPATLNPLNLTSLVLE